MTRQENVGNTYPLFNRHGVRMNFENPISTTVNTNPDRYELVENFYKAPKINADIQNAAEATRMIANSDFEILGNNGANADVTFSATVAGIQCQTDGGSGDQVIILPHLDAGQSAWTQVKWGTENQVIWQMLIRTGAAVTSVTEWHGLKLTNTETIATDDDQAYFRFDATDDTNWNAIYSIGGTDVSIDTGIAVTADTNYSLRIEIDADRKPHFYINDKEVGSGTALTNDVDLIPYNGVQDDSAAAREMVLSQQKMSRKIFE